MSDHDFDFEPQPGIPAPLPEGEEILWQGKPDMWMLARDAFKIRWMTGIMLFAAAWRTALLWHEEGARVALPTAVLFLLMAAVVYGLMLLLAWAQARAAIYTITSARAILRIGAALQVTFTIPFTVIESMSLAKLGRKGFGTIALQNRSDMRLSYGVLWPHARPWHFRAPQAAFRCIPEAEKVARILSEAAQAKLNEPQVAAAPKVGAGLAVAE